MDYNDYSEKYTIGSLRKILSQLGGTPGTKNKDELISEILKIESGEITPTRSKRGRPPRGAGGRNENVAVVSQCSDGDTAYGVLEFVAEGYGFLRAENCDNSPKDSFVAKPTIQINGLKEGDYVIGKFKKKRENQLPEVVEIVSVNGKPVTLNRRRFDSLTPTYPNERITLKNGDLSLRVVDLFAPIGYGQRGLIVAPPKTGKTTLLKKLALAIENEHPEATLLVFLVDERPEEVTDFKQGLSSEVVYSTFDSQPEHHVRIAELMMKRVKSMMESGLKVVLLMDSITKLARAYNSVVPSSGKVLSGGLDPQALVFPKKFFGLARNTDCGSLTIIATALIETGSRMDDVIFEEFKGTGNMEIVLSRALAEKRVFPAIDIKKSGTRKEEMLLSDKLLKLSYKVRRILDDTADTQAVLDMMAKTADNEQFADKIDGWLKLIKN